MIDLTTPRRMLVDRHRGTVRIRVVKQCWRWWTWLTGQKEIHVVTIYQDKHNGIILGRGIIKSAEGLKGHRRKA